ncbi:MAG: dihydrolipoyl dehydrogenase [Candidatus Bathyarchaeia archaeon]
MALNKELDVAVIGAGPAGFAASIKAARLGGKVALVEKSSLGGTCLNKGCIPMKIALYVTKLLEDFKKSQAFGFSLEYKSFDIKKLAQKKEQTVQKLSSKIEETIKKIKTIDFIKGKASLRKPNEIEVIDEKGNRSVINCKKVIIATGSEPLLLNTHELSIPEKSIMAPEDFFALQNIPKSVLINNGDVIGVETAYLFNSLGVQTTLIEKGSSILPKEDKEIAIKLQRLMASKGIKVFTNSRIKEVKEDKAIIVTKSGEKEIEASKIVLTERVPCIKELNLDNLGIKVNNEGIEVNEKMETNVYGIYAVGDVVGGKWAHLASYQGEVAAENAMGNETIIDYKAIPRCLFTSPEVAFIGLSEDEAKEKGYKVKTGGSMFLWNSRANILEEGEGFIKIVVDEKFKEMLGIHMIGPMVTELINECSLALKLEATLDDLANTVHMHPTLAEALKDTASMMLSMWEAL